MRIWDLEGRRVSWQATHSQGGGGCADLILLSSEAAAFRVVPATVLLHLPFVYSKVRKKRGADGGREPTVSPLRGCACVLLNCLMKGTFVSP